MATNYKNELIKEHSDLVIRITELDDFLYGNDGMNIHTNIENNKTQEELLHNMTEYANKCMQLMCMRNYLKALECRLNNEGIYYSDGEYLESVAKIKQIN